MKIKVDYNKPYEEYLSKIDNKYIDKEVLNAVPKADSGEIEIEFFKLDKYVTCDELEKEYESRNLRPLNPYELFAIIDKDSELLDEKKYVGTQWKDSNGKWCYAAFNWWSDDERNVDVGRRSRDWGDGWFVSARRKSDLNTETLNTSSDTLSLDLSKAIEMVKGAGYQVIKIM